ncbi:hypothetical protein HZH66_003552 [Vespula vulgaris]|uniref:Uncharacterized protein n=1 Tax=Vespula vulgaris TaxID=7454 RepID=A0A834KDA1_VESVU|nr:hypothetical protein HZH66_003552 [Vespula vulgaris]
MDEKIWAQRPQRELSNDPSPAILVRLSPKLRNLAGGSVGRRKAPVAPSTPEYRSPVTDQKELRYSSLCKSKQKYLKVNISETTPPQCQTNMRRDRAPYLKTIFRSLERSPCALHARISFTKIGPIGAEI